MTRALITGVNGFCARHLVARLRKETGYEVIGSDLAPPESGTSDLHVFRPADIGDPRQVRRLIEDVAPDVIFNLAGSRGANARDVYRANLLAVTHLLEACRGFERDTKFLQVGSAAEYGVVESVDLPVTESHACSPVGAYGASKFAATIACLEYADRFGMKVVVARPFNVVGAGISENLVLGAVAARARKALCEGAEPVIRAGNLDGRRDFVAVGDVVEAYVTMVAGAHWGQVFNLCSGESRSIRDVLMMLLSNSPVRFRIEVDKRLVPTFEVRSIHGSCEKARNAFGFAPRVPIETALASVWNGGVCGKPPCAS
ncbi:MAG: NAD-dependent epimerase/dehydratase family protein [Deltaproteobacteria bacterium]|nr:NAD-dependent epimerase/dehydratase family protein [Deltaproteobacteria bacterium]